jgi:tRNA (uracil-5-)-methyltransferase
MVELRIDSLTNMGWGIGRIPLAEKKIETNNENDTLTTVDEKKDAPRPWVVMVPHVVVGELVRVRIFRNQRNYSEADLIEIIEASPNRVVPKCSLAGLCGGCQYQHMSIEAQRGWKTNHVREVLRQQQIVGYEEEEKIEVLPTLGTPEVFHYRSKITPHYQSPREVGANVYEIEAIGFQQSSNDKIVDVPECPIATEAINDEYKARRKELLRQASDGSLAVKKTNKRQHRKWNGTLGATLLFRQADDDDDGNPVVVTDHNQYMTTTVGDLKFRYLAGNFFQNNNYVLPLMVNAVLEAATKPTTSENVSPSHLVDCYCGSGLFALSAASWFDLCVGIEVNNKAVEEATENANLNGISNCQFIAASAEAIFMSERRGIAVKDFPRNQTVVVLDPPRKGCSPEFLEQLYEYSAERVVYMSCDPATQARDAKGIVEIGGYDIVSVLPFDLFPQTKHIECLIVFEKSPTRKSRPD